MNPYEIERLAKQHTSDIRKAAAWYHIAAARRDRTRSIRHRTGWALVQIGLSLISTANGPGNGPTMLASVTGSATSQLDETEAGDDVPLEVVCRTVSGDIRIARAPRADARARRSVPALPAVNIPETPPPAS